MTRGVRAAAAHAARDLGGKVVVVVGGKLAQVWVLLKVCAGLALRVHGAVARVDAVALLQLAFVVLLLLNPPSSHGWVWVVVVDGAVRSAANRDLICRPAPVNGQVGTVKRCTRAYCARVDASGHKQAFSFPF